ncbi:zinc finger protein 62-like [Pseudomyrmex gracilis]|uniref:zinc finger protein 62-like n=1 Tax=Pseudomyrmex gracilis TaxID=219809 RepID=UPI0009951E31|nr:zinc finger protein 62-like [Pseudomyrmex gracilis]
MASTSTGVTSEASTSAEQQYQCQVCDAVFENKSILSKHYNTCHKHNDTFLCTKCDYTTGYLGNLKKHTSIHLNDSSSHSFYTCKVCDAVFENKSILSKHYHSSHKHNNTFLCTKCDFTTKNLYNLKVHTSIHLNDSLYTCGICDKDFSTLQEFQNHQNDHKCMMSNMLVCSICTNRNFYLFWDLLNHHIQVHLNKVLYICVVCDSVLKTRLFSQHYYACHRHNSNYVCAKCDCTTTHFKNLEIHAEQMHLYDKSYCMASF